MHIEYRLNRLKQENTGLQLSLDQREARIADLEQQLSYHRSSNKHIQFLEGKLRRIGAIVETNQLESS
jgi:hypothetical protein